MSLIEEDIVLGLVADKGTKVLAHHTMPVGSVLLVELLLYVFGHEVLHLEVVHCVLGLRCMRVTSFIASAIMSELSGMSIMFSFFIASVICNLKYIHSIHSNIFIQNNC